MKRDPLACGRPAKKTGSLGGARGSFLECAMTLLEVVFPYESPVG